MDTVKVIAPAKVNLFLGIGAKREDGYHDATTVMHTLAMHDTITMTRVPAGMRVTLAEPGDAAQPIREIEVCAEAGSGLTVGANMLWAAGLDPAAVSDEDNLACRAVRELAQQIGRTEDEVIRIVIDKQVPHQSGLGGGSSDAAAALVGAAKLWGVPRDDESVLAVARSLGADVTFFLYGGSSLLAGRGDEFVRALVPRRDTVVIVRPESGVSTAHAYDTFDANSLVPEQALLTQLDDVQNAEEVPLFNNLTDPACSINDDLQGAMDSIVSCEGVTDALLCGSGSAIFAICRDFASAQAAVSRVQCEGYWARATSFSPLGAAVLP